MMTKRPNAWLLSLMVVSTSMVSAMDAKPVDHPCVVGFDRFYKSTDEVVHQTEGGRLLLGELNCTACHAPPKEWKERLSDRGVISLSGVGSRLGVDDLRAFVSDPQQHKKGTLMPGMFSGKESDQKVMESLVSYLGSLKGKTKAYPKANLENGKVLYHTIGCVACHAPAATQDYKPVEAPEGAPELKVSLPSVPIVLAGGYDEAALAAFLQDPLSIRHGGRMPATELTDQEAVDVAAYLKSLIKSKTTSVSAAKATASSLIEAGRRQFIAQRCSACHETDEKQQVMQAAPIAQLKPEQGCLSNEKITGVPDYGLSEFQRKTLQLAVKSVQTTAPPSETAAQKVDTYFQRMNCYACHEKNGTGGLEEGRAQYFTVYEPVAHSLGEIGRLPPKLDIVGRKLTTAWMEKMLWGDHGGVRGYMTARMPRFGKENSAQIIPLLAEVSKRTEPVQMDTSGLLKHHRAEAGRVLMGVGTGGMGCVSCHGLKDRKSLGVPVINLSHTVQRLQPEYFKELLLNPQVTQPGTLMPPLFMGRKQANEEIETLWTYLKEIDQSRLPEGLLQTGDYELKPEKEGKPIVFRTFLEGAGMQAVAVGYPQGIHVAFDALEVRWALAWKGRFLDAMTTWEERAMTPVKPLGDRIHAFRLSMPFAKLSSVNDAWPEAYGVEAGYLFKGYRLSKEGVTVFRYEVGSLKVEDSMQPDNDGKSFLHKVTVQGIGEGWYFMGLAHDALPQAVLWNDGTAVFEEHIEL
ncbi:c-type cytochrome [soil metagenome]